MIVYEMMLAITSRSPICACLCRKKANSFCVNRITKSLLKSSKSTQSIGIGSISSEVERLSTLSHAQGKQHVSCHMSPEVNGHVETF